MPVQPYVSFKYAIFVLSENSKRKLYSIFNSQLPAKPYINFKPITSVEGEICKNNTNTLKFKPTILLVRSIYYRRLKSKEVFTSTFMFTVLVANLDYLESYFFLYKM